MGDTNDYKNMNIKCKPRGINTMTPEGGDDYVETIGAIPEELVAQLCEQMRITQKKRELETPRNINTMSPEEINYYLESISVIPKEMAAELLEQKRIAQEIIKQKKYEYGKKWRTENRERYNTLVGIRIKRCYENNAAFREHVKLYAKQRYCLKRYNLTVDEYEALKASGELEKLYKNKKNINDESKYEADKERLKNNPTKHQEMKMLEKQLQTSLNDESKYEADKEKLKNNPTKHQEMKMQKKKPQTSLKEGKS